MTDIIVMLGALERPDRRFLSVSRFIKRNAERLQQGGVAWVLTSTLTRDRDAVGSSSRAIAANL